MEKTVSSPLFQEIHKGKASTVQKLVDTGINVNEPDSLNEWTGLHHASFLGNAKIAEILINSGANINAQDRDGYTPLHLAAANNKQKVASLLLKAGANSNILDKYGRSPIDVACKDEKMISIFTENGVDSDGSTTIDEKESDDQFVNSPALRHRYVFRDATRKSSNINNSNNNSDVSRKLKFTESSSPYQNKNTYLHASPSRAVQFRPVVTNNTNTNASPRRGNPLAYSADDAALRQNTVNSPLNRGHVNNVQNGDNNAQTGDQQNAAEPTQETNFQKIWVKVKHVAKWQIMSIAVRILLIYLLELFVDHLKRFLQFVVLSYSPIELILLLVIQPLQFLLKPLLPLLAPLFQPLWTMFVSIMTPFMSILQPLLTMMVGFFQPFATFFVTLGGFILERLNYFFTPIFKLFWEPISKIFSGLITILSPLFSSFTQFWQAIYTAIKPFFGAIGKFIVALFTPLFQSLYRVGLLILQPVFVTLQKIGSAIVSVFVQNHQKILEKIMQAIQPMLNIRGFLSRVFGPLITGLKAILHWFLPESLLEPINRLSVYIFGDQTQMNQMNTEETALMVIFVFVVIVYGSIISWGYFFKVGMLTLHFYDASLSTAFYGWLSHLARDTIETAEDIVTGQPHVHDIAGVRTLDVGIKWFITPDATHHLIGTIFFTLSILVVLAFKFSRFMYEMIKIASIYIVNRIKNAHNSWEQRKVMRR